jgi:hypothetical protein
LRTCSYLLFSALLFTAAITLACGGSGSPTNVESVIVNPAEADAQQYGGEVQYVATVRSTIGSTPYLPLSWGVCYNNAPTSEATISQLGVAACATGATGTYSVFATSGPECTSAPSACGTGCQITGYAKLTCP